MKIFLLILNILAFIAVLCWFIFEPGWESGSSCIAAFVVLVSQFFWNESAKRIFRINKTTSKNNSKNRVGNMNQTAGDNSTQYQSAGNMTVNNK
jgi:hypothetical protein